MLAPLADLASKSCVPCRGGVPPLRGPALRELQAQIDPAWKVSDEHHLERSVKVRDFAAALALANRVGEIAEREGHHPDLLVRWGELGVKLFTHKIDGLTESDFVLAAKIDALLLGGG
jgi:4a-hydroxytetrahydrobiopterin dehydratase